ncbi:hypothetical protein IY145_20420 [Methylosinus sp. H3A]|uniref:hypothetical protein n=1 Tax=Methylosinus sp. H3A TaxID=2785786 RepID=UPI0018C25D54|nr:hypothetical protein [Methylosinus sp. H3A]MBG0811721.1 hypothetical protein [Methylosinus sp. H3A]
MNRLRELRLWTAIAVAVIAGFAMLAAAKLLAFGLADLTAETANAAKTLALFVDDPMVGAIAETRLLELDAGASDHERRERLSRLLARIPLSGGAWLALAQARFETEEPMEKVESALAMSSLVAPNEGWLMSRRAAFAIPLWPRLAVAARRSLVADLVGGWEGTPGVERDALVSIVYLSPGETQDEVRAALLRSGVAGAQVAAEIGLTPSPPLR